MNLPPIVSPQEWQAAWEQMLVKEKELTHARDALAFEGRSQLAVYRFFFEPDVEGWPVPWYTITDGFDTDFDVDEWHGTNLFFRDGDRVFRTYLINGRGDEALGAPSATSTAPRSGARRSGRTHPTAIRSRRPTSCGGGGPATTSSPPAESRRNFFGRRPLGKGDANHPEEVVPRDAGRHSRRDHPSR